MSDFDTDPWDEDKFAASLRRTSSASAIPWRDRVKSSIILWSGVTAIAVVLASELAKQWIEARVGPAVRVVGEVFLAFVAWAFLVAMVAAIGIALGTVITFLLNLTLP